MIQILSLICYANKLLRKLRIIISVVPVDEKIVDPALNSNFIDFEDGLQYFTARENNIRILQELVIQTPEQYLKSLRKVK